MKLRKAEVVLTAYNHTWLKVLGLGETELQVQCGGWRYELLLRVGKEDGPSLIGRDGFSILSLIGLLCVIGSVLHWVTKWSER